VLGGAWRFTGKQRTLDQQSLCEPRIQDVSPGVHDARVGQAGDALLASKAVEEDNLLWIRGAATYRAEGFPELVLALKETIHFEDGLSCRIVE
jgi:hypothetical protein